ncbi:MAG: TrkA C-terminal domain-containing protein [Candidatus Omnitrophota bacterium]|nr:MAG: TrkA C-terminal domain-containing protein [Candidatus Omnitrophota bacterium]
MGNLIFAIPVILVIAISVFVVRIATVALKMTGLDEKRAYFQALSAFTGTGFTTKDSELVIENDIRRKIIIFLMILGNAGLITVITTLVISFGRGNIAPLLINVAILLLLIFILFKILGHKGVTKFLNDKIESRLEKRPLFQKRPVEEVLRVAKNYGIAEVSIKDNCQDLGKTLSESSFRENDILILAIERKDNVIPTPKASDRILLNDTLICYGKLSNIEKITSTG